MKRIVCLCLAVLLLSGLSTAVAEEKENDMFFIWDIPFRTPSIDFFKKAFDKTGFTFLPGNLDDIYYWKFFGFQEDDQILTIDFEWQKPLLFGYDLAEVFAAFSNEGFRIILFRFAAGKRDDDYRQMCEDIFNALYNKYGGMPTDGIFAVKMDGIKSYYDLPIRNGKIDQKVLKNAFRWGDNTTLTMDWKNIRFYAFGFYGMRIIITDELPTPLEREESLGYYTDVVPETVRIYDSGL